MKAQELKPQTEFKSALLPDYTFIIQKVTDKRVSYYRNDNKSHRVYVNTIRVNWVSVKQAQEYLDSNHWIIISK